MAGNASRMGYCRHEDLEMANQARVKTPFLVLLYTWTERAYFCGCRISCIQTFGEAVHVCSGTVPHTIMSWPFRCCLATPYTRSKCPPSQHSCRGDCVQDLSGIPDFFPSEIRNFRIYLRQQNTNISLRWHNNFRLYQVQWSTQTFCRCKEVEIQSFC
ncbi:hypothetical protein AVEN_187312-1 [Araneus ventricosus]|uniref:Uncharacterized protein n=1 Tax=Araneus ventricosus TaxID=182803 RepID=A0A4Y2RPM2_ARAVE|nr:hypothetical protein AVEN_187312-1 [Araneus ventricosus]